MAAAHRLEQAPPGLSSEDDGPTEVMKSDLFASMVSHFQAAPTTVDSSDDEAQPTSLKKTRVFREAQGVEEKL